MNRKDFKDINFTVVAEPHGHHVDYKVYEVPAWNMDGSPLFTRKGSDSFDPVESIEESELYLHGYVKWDGCSNWYFDHQDEGMLHGCSRENLVAIGEVMARCWDWTKELLPTWVDL